MLKIIFFSIVIVLAVTAIFLPNRIVDTRSCKKNWVVIGLILTSALAIVDKDTEARIIFLCLSLGVLMNCVFAFVGLASKSKVSNNERSI